MKHITIHNNLNQLRLLSSLVEGQRLDTRNGLSIYDNTILNWLLRKWHHDNKEETVKYLQYLYIDISGMIDQLSCNIDEETKYILINTSALIRSSIHGIENLAKTYKAYPRISTALEGIVYDIAIPLYYKTIHKLVDCEQKKEYKFLYEPITYFGKRVNHLSYVVEEEDSDLDKNE